MSQKRRPESSPPTLQSRTTWKQVKKPRLEIGHPCQTAMSQLHQDQENLTEQITGVSPGSAIAESTAAGLSPDDSGETEDADPDVMMSDASDSHMTDVKSPKEKETGEVSPHKSPSKEGSSRKSKKKTSWKLLQDNSGERGAKGKKKKPKNKKSASKDQTGPKSPGTQQQPSEFDTELAEMSDNKQDRDISFPHHLERPTTEEQFEARLNMEQPKTDEKCESKKEKVSVLESVSDPVQTRGKSVEQTKDENEGIESRTTEKDIGKQRKGEVEGEEEMESAKKLETEAQLGKTTETETPCNANANELQDIPENHSDKTFADSDIAPKGTESTGTPDNAIECSVDERPSECDNAQANNIPSELAVMSDNKQDRDISAPRHLEGPTTEAQFGAKQNMEQPKTDEKCESMKEKVSMLESVSDPVQTHGKSVKQTKDENECTESRTAEKDEGEQRRDEMKGEDEIESTRRPETLTEHGKNTETEACNVYANEMQEVPENRSDKTDAQTKVSLPDSDLTQEGSESTVTPDNVNIMDCLANERPSDCENTQAYNIPSDQVLKITKSRTILDQNRSEENPEASHTDNSRTADSSFYGGNSDPSSNSTCESTRQSGMAPVASGAYLDGSQLDSRSTQETIEPVHIKDHVIDEKTSSVKDEKDTSDEYQNKVAFMKSLDQDQYGKTTTDIFQRADNTAILSFPPGIKLEVPPTGGPTGFETDFSSSVKTENDSPSVQPQISEIAEMKAKQNKDVTGTIKQRDEADVVKSVGGTIGHEKGQGLEGNRVNDTGSGPGYSKYGFKGNRKDKWEGNGQNMKGQSGLSDTEEKEQIVSKERPVEDQQHSIRRQDSGKQKRRDNDWQQGVIMETLQANLSHEQKAECKDSRQRGGKHTRVQDNKSGREIDCGSSGVRQRQSKMDVKEKLGEDMGRKKIVPSSSTKNLENKKNLRETSEVMDTHDLAALDKMSKHSHSDDDGEWVEVKLPRQEGKTDTDHFDMGTATKTCPSEKQTSGNKFSDSMNEQDMNCEELKKPGGEWMHTESNLEEQEKAFNKTQSPTKSDQKSPQSGQQGGGKGPRKLSKRLQRLERSEAKQRECLQQEQKMLDQKGKVNKDKNTTVSQSLKSGGLAAASAGWPRESFSENQNKKDVDYAHGKQSEREEEKKPDVLTRCSDGSDIFDDSCPLSSVDIWDDQHEAHDNSKLATNEQKKKPDSSAQTSAPQGLPKAEVKSPGEGKGGRKRQRKWKKLDLEGGSQMTGEKKKFREPAKKSNFETPAENTQPEKRRSRWNETGRDRSPRSYSPRGRDWDVYAHESKVMTSNSGEKFTLFFGWQNPLSQHHPARFEIDGVHFNCTEQYMMREKAVMFKDPEMLKRIMSTNDPKEQKRCGRQVKGFDVDVWEQHCWDVVEKANMAKFSQNEKLKKAIFDTAGTTLVEASPWDQKWGIGLKATDSRAWNRESWCGENWLGQILTAVRDKLMAAEGHTVAASALEGYEECKRKAQSGQRSDILTAPKRGRSPRGTSPRGRQKYDESVVVTSETGEKITLFFGRNNPLSQFFQASFQIDGWTYNCAEQYVMYQKAALFEDFDMADLIMNKVNPRDQEKCGEKIKGFDADTWDQYAWGYLVTANMEKFSQNQALKKVLFDTAGTTLAEASPYDRKWGIGLRADDPRACNPTTWLGENWLGQALMTVRDQLKAAEGFPWSMSTEKSYTYQSSQVAQANPSEHEYRVEKSAEGHSNQNKDNRNEARTEGSSHGYPDQNEIKSEKPPSGQSDKNRLNLSEHKMGRSPQGLSDQSKQNLNQTMKKRQHQGYSDQSKQNCDETRNDRSPQDLSDQSKQNLNETRMKRSVEGQSDQSGFNILRRDRSPRGNNYDQNRDNWNRDRSHSSQHGGQYYGGEQSKLQHDSRTVKSDNEEMFTIFFGFRNPLSQHHIATFQIDGVKYNCIQQYIMKKKADLFEDHRTGKIIMSKHYAREQEKCGKMIKGVDEEMWEKHRWGYTEEANKAKFSQNENLRKALFETKGTTIVEAIPWDEKGGIGLEATDPRAYNRSSWRGENRIGNILTKVRDLLMAEQGCEGS